MLFNRLRDFPNHFIENGILYRGEGTRRIVKVDHNGCCTIKYKGVSIRTKIDNLAKVKAELPTLNKLQKTDNVDIDRYLIYTAIHAGWTQKEICEHFKVNKNFYFRSKKSLPEFKNFENYCNKIGISHNNFRAYAKSKAMKKQSQLTNDDKFHWLIKYVERENEGGKYKSLSKLCEHYGINRQSYYSWMSYKGLKPSHISVRLNEPYIQEYKLSHQRKKK